MSRARLAAAGVGDAVEEIRTLARGARSVTWTLGPSTTPADLGDRLRALGFGPPDPPNETRFAALVLTHEPPRVDGIEIRRVESLEDFLVALEIALEANAYDDEGAARERAQAGRTYERRRSRPGGEWLAYLGGRAAAIAGAVASAEGSFLVGGSTASWAQGHGCYRALVRARWDDAVARGTPALVVHAQHRTSRPILERLRFELVCEVHELQDRARL